MPYWVRPVHCLGVDIVVFFFVLNKPSLLLESLEVVGGFGVDFRVVLVSARFEVDFRLDYVV